MPATIQIHEMDSLTSGVNKTTSTVRFKTSDNNVVDANDPLIIPSSGIVFSYAKKLRIYMDDPPDVQVDNFNWYTTEIEGFSTGVNVTVKNIGITWMNNYNTQMTDGEDLFSKVINNRLDGDITDIGPFIPADNNSYIGDLIELQMSVASTAQHGVLPPKNITFSYDEI